MTYFLAFFAAVSGFGQSADWRVLQFRGIPALHSSVMDGKITLEVKSSAGGLVRSLPKETRVKSLVVTGSVKGELKVEADHLWEKGQDDAFLRVGLIVATPGVDGRFTMRVDLPETLELVGLWLMADGDDSGSTFTVVVDSLELIAP